MLRFWFLGMITLAVMGCGGDTAVTPPPSPLPATAVSPTATASSSLQEAPILQWQYAVGDGAAAPAVAAGSVIVVASDTAVTGLNPASGEVVWQVSPDGGVWPRSLAGNGATVVVGVPGGLLALTAADGRILWQTETAGDVLWPPLVADTAVYAGTAFVGPGIAAQPDKRAWFYALDAASGDVLWSQETAAYTLTTPAANEEAVVVGGSFLSDEEIEEGGHLRFYAFARQDGALQWTAERTEGFLKSLAVDGERLYFLAYADMLFALDMAGGQEVWRYSTENWSPGFTFVDGALYIGSDNAFVHAIDGRNGTAVWRVHQEGIFNAPRSEPALADGRLYFQSNDNKLYSLNAADGAILWQTDPQPRSRVAPVAAYGRLYLLGQ
ncbi:MAG TPA: hypothetical protein ENK32_12390, partial [Anaerolineae bacterium]|nr:hypothetical protein [Anaerolineae bacterium]